MPCATSPHPARSQLVRATAIGSRLSGLDAATPFSYRTFGADRGGSATTRAMRSVWRLRAGDVDFERPADETGREVGFVDTGGGAAEFVVVAVLGGCRAGARGALLVGEGDVVDGAQCDLVDVWRVGVGCLHGDGS